MRAGAARCCSRVSLCALAALEGRILYLQLVDKDFLDGASERSPSAYGADLGASRLADGSVRRAARRQHARRLDLRQSEGAEDGAGPARRARRAARSGRRLARASHHEQPRARIRLSRSARRRRPRREQVLALGLPGVGTVREYRRYYPAGEVTGHVIGFTNVDDRGQEGLEAAFDYWLKGESGSKRVLQDRRGQVIRDVELLAAARPGRDLRTSIDLRIQYLAYRELKAAVSDSARAVGLGRRARPANRRSARDGQSAVVQPERPRRNIGPKTIATARSPTSSSPARASSRS